MQLGYCHAFLEQLLSAVLVTHTPVRGPSGWGDMRWLQGQHLVFLEESQLVPSAWPNGFDDFLLVTAMLKAIVKPHDKGPFNSDKG